MKIALVCVALLAGCATPAAAPQPSPSPNLSAEYMRIVAPVNASADALGAVVRVSPPNFDSIRRAAAAYQVALGKFNTDLLALAAEARPSIRADIDALRHQVASDEVAVGDVAHATDSGVFAALQALYAIPDKGEASQVRSDFGLAPPPAPSPTT